MYADKIGSLHVSILKIYEATVIDHRLCEFLDNFHMSLVTRKPYCSKNKATDQRLIPHSRILHGGGNCKRQRLQALEGLPLSCHKLILEFNRELSRPN